MIEQQNRILAILAMAMFAIPMMAEEESGTLPLWLEVPLWLIAIIVVPVVLIVVFVGMYKKVFMTLWYFISFQSLRRKKLRNRLAEGMDYYRQPPAGGDLKVANAVMNSISSALMADYKGLFGALILRLVDKGAMKMEVKSNVYGAEPHVVLSASEWPNNVEQTEETELEKSFHDLLSQAAGSDKVLQPREIQYFLRNNENDFLISLTTLSPEQKKVAEDPNTARQLLALRKYLLDFSLIKERDVNEMKLWKEYLVYAMFFGIADKVCENFKEVYPDYFKANALASMQLNIVGNNALVTYVDAANDGVTNPKAKTEQS